MTDNWKLPPLKDDWLQYILLILKVKVDIPYQKVMDYVNHFGLYRKTVSLICSMCLCVIVIPLYKQHTPALYGVWWPRIRHWPLP